MHRFTIMPTACLLPRERRPQDYGGTEVKGVKELRVDLRNGFRGGVPRWIRGALRMTTEQARLDIGEAAASLKNAEFMNFLARGKTAWTAACCLCLIGAWTQAAPLTEDRAGESTEEQRASLLLQEQAHAAALAAERTRQESATAGALAARLEAMEETIYGLHRAQLQAAQTPARVELLVLELFAAVGLATLLFIAYHQWRTVARLTGLNPSHRVQPAPIAPLTNAESLIDAANHRILAALSKLEQRMVDLEKAIATHPAAPAPIVSPPQGPGVPYPAPKAMDAPNISAPSRQTQILDLLKKGQTELGVGRAEDAIVLFDGLLALDPQHADALVKKGSALEKLAKFNEALECYDRAIAADDSMTMAYLCKGGLCNRLERFDESVKCYELALRTQEKKRAA